jgi:hypothetical protein
MIYFRDPGAEQKFKDISNAYEVGPTVHTQLQIPFLVVGLYIYLCLHRKDVCRFCLMMRSDRSMINMEKQV